MKRTTALLLFASGVLELATSLHRPGGQISMWLHGLRQAYPDCGTLYALSSSPFLALLLCAPLLVRTDAPGPHRLSFLAPCLPHLLARPYLGAVHAMRAAAVLAGVWAFLGLLETLVRDPFHFRDSLYAPPLLGCACLLRFVLLDLPEVQDVWIPDHECAAEVGVDGCRTSELVVFSRPTNWMVVGVDFLHPCPRLLRASTTGLAVKRAGERVFLFLPGSAYAPGLLGTIRLGQTAIKVLIDVAVTQKSAEIRVSELDLSAGLPTPATIQADVRLLDATVIRPAIREHPKFQTLEEKTTRYLQRGAGLPGRDIGAMREFVAEMEAIRQAMTEAGDALAQDFAHANAEERFRLGAGLLYGRVYVEDVHLSPQATAAFQEIRTGLLDTLAIMQRDKEANILGVAQLLKAVENLDLSHVEIRSLVRAQAGGVLQGTGADLLTDGEEDAPQLSVPTETAIGKTIFGQPVDCFAGGPRPGTGERSNGQKDDK